MSDEEVTDEENARIDDLTHDLHVRHRIDIAKMHFGKDGGYSLRKFKRIFKREMAERPHLYFIDRPGKKGSKKDKSEIEAALGEIDLDSLEKKSKKEDGAAEGEEVDLEAEKEKDRAEFTKLAEEMNADSEDETYNFAEDELEELLTKVED